MAVSQARMRRNVQDNLPIVGGGGVGVAAPAALREFADVQNGQPFSIIGDDPTSVVGRLSRPSVAYGLVGGTLSGLLWMADVGPSALQEFYIGHTLTALPAGAASAALPVEGSGGGGETAQQQSQAQRMRRRSRSAPGSNGEFAAADGRSPETSPAN